MRRRALTLSVLLVLGGVLVSVSPTAAFSTVDADRATSVTIAPDDEALLALDGTGNNVTDRNTPTTVAVLRNNLGENVTVTYEVTTTNGGTVAENVEDPVTLAPGETTDVDVSCAPSGGGSGTAEVVVTVSEAEATNVAIRDAELTATFGYDCPGNGPGGNSDRGNGA